jgi:hypothetical protein
MQHPGYVASSGEHQGAVLVPVGMLPPPRGTTLKGTTPRTDAPPRVVTRHGHTHPPNTCTCTPTATHGTAQHRTVAPSGDTPGASPSTHTAFPAPY